VLFARGPSAGVFTVFDLYQVYLPLALKIVSSVQFPMRSSMLHLLKERSGRWFGFNGYGSNQNAIRATYGLSVSDTVPGSKRASRTSWSQLGNVLLWACSEIWSMYSIFVSW